MNPPYKFVIKDGPNYDIEEEDYTKDPKTAVELDDDLSYLTGGLYRVPNSTIRWYRNIGIIDKPIAKRGRTVLYDYSTYYELLGIYSLRDTYNLKIEKVIALKQSYSTLHTIAYVLQMIENKFLLENSAPIIGKYLKSISRGMVTMEDQEERSVHKIKIGQIMDLMNEWEQLPGRLLRSKNIIIPMIRDDYFSMVLEGIDPQSIVIEIIENE